MRMGTERCSLEQNLLISVDTQISDMKQMELFLLLLVLISFCMEHGETCNTDSRSVTSAKAIRIWVVLR